MQQSIIKSEMREGDFHPHQSITWSAVISGALLAFGLTFLFNLLLIGVGLAVYTTGHEGREELALYGFLFTLIGGFILLFMAGWKTGNLIKYCPKAYESEVSENKHCPCYHGATHGFLAWVIYLILSLTFFSFIAQSTSLSFMKTPYLEFAQMNDHPQGAHANAMMAAKIAVSKAILAEKVTAQVIGTFLIFLFGAIGCSIGSYLGFLSKKKCYAHPNAQAGGKL